MAIFNPSSRDSGPGEIRPNRSLGRPLLLAAKWIAVVIVFPILLGAAVFAFLVNSERGHAYLIKLIQKQAGESLGVPVHLQNLDLHLPTLSVDLYGLTIDSAGPHSYPPLLQVQHAEASVRVVSVLGRKWYFDSIRIDNPVAQVFVDKFGNSNLPTFKSGSSGSSTSVFDLGIRHAVLTKGAVFYNNEPSAIALDLRDVGFNASFNSLSQKYSGNLTYSNGRLIYAGSQAARAWVSRAIRCNPEHVPSLFRPNRRWQYKSRHQCNHQQLRRARRAGPIQRDSGWTAVSYDTAQSIYPQRTCFHLRQRTISNDCRPFAAAEHPRER